MKTTQTTLACVVLCIIAPWTMAPVDPPGCDICNELPNPLLDDIWWNDGLLELVIKNDGETQAGGFWVDVFVDQTNTPAYGDLSTTYVWVSSLAPGETVTLSISQASAPQLAHVITDSTDILYEHSKDDNVFADITGF